MKFLQIPLKQIDPSKTNPRKHFKEEAHKELTESVEAHGIIEPLIVRPMGVDDSGPRYELVAGERRWRAARSANLEMVPAIVRELTDAEALEIQMIENLQRDDLSPLEEARGYELMLALKRPDGSAVYTADTLAVKIGKGSRYIYKRLTLLHLPKEPAELLEKGEMSFSLALLIARIPGDKAKKEATQKILHPRYHDGPLSWKETLKLVQEEFMRQLKGAPFDQTDPDLIPTQGPCSTCPHRTGNNPLYQDVSRPDVCTMPACYALKSEAAWKRRVAAAKADGVQIMSEEDAGKEFESWNNSLRWNSPYSELSKPLEHVGGAAERKPLRELLKGAPQVPVILARDTKGNVRELVRTELAVEAVKTKHPELVEKVTRAGKRAPSEAEKQQRVQEKIDTAARLLAMRELGAKVEKLGPVAGMWVQLAKILTSHAGSDGCRLVAKAREVEAKSGDTYGAADRIAQGFADLPDQQEADRLAFAFVIQCLVAEQMRWRGVEAEHFSVAAKVFGLDVAGIKAAARAQVEGKKKKAKPATATTPAKPAKKKTTPNSAKKTPTKAKK